MEEDPFLRRYQPSELKIASEFLSTWLSFLSRDLCKDCVHVLSDRIRSLDPAGSCSIVRNVESGETSSDYGVKSPRGLEDDRDCDNHSLPKDGETGFRSLAEPSGSFTSSQPAVTETSSPRMSWADMAQENELEEEVEDQRGSESSDDVKTPEKPQLSREQRERLRLMNVKRKKDFICLERVKGKIVNIVEGLELHTGVFSAVEQKRIVDQVYELQEKGRKGKLKERTFTAPQKWMRGKGRVTIQFGCCYNYAIDRAGNPPGILQQEQVDPLPHLFKVIIRRLVKWHVIPPSCVPDSCIVNIYDEGDCIPPHIDNHDFVRPFCTISFLSECNILFGSNLKVEGPGEFSGLFSIPLPVGSVLVLNGNGADVAKHCVPAVPTKRISITFRKMDESKRPVWFTPEPDLQGIQPLPYELNPRGSTTTLNDQSGSNRRQLGRGRGSNTQEESRGYYGELSSNQRRGKPRPSITKG